LQPLSVSSRRELESDTLAHEKSLETALPYLQARGINRDTAEKFRLGVVDDSTSRFHGRLSIPALLPSGAPYSLRYRALDPEVQPKYLGDSGKETRLFNVRAIHQPGDTIHITEGELDAVVLDSLGFASVGVCGSNAWKRHHPRMFAGFARVFVWGDGDSAGSAFASKVSDSLLSVVQCRVPQGMDVTDLMLAEGEPGIRKAMGQDE
jgi:DNA primase